MYALSLGSFPPRLKKKNGAFNFLRSNLKSNLQIWVTETRTLKTSNLNQICDALLTEQSSVATSNVQWGWRGFLHRCASSCKQTGEGLSQTVTSAKREVKEGDAS